MEKVENSKHLGEEKISKLLLKFSIPCILSLLVSSLYNIVDQIFIGNSELGYLGNAATTVVFPITVIALAFAWCFGDGSAAYLSICQGKSQSSDAHKCIGNNLVMTFFISILFLIIGFTCMDPILYLFGASSTSIGYAREYFIIILAAFPVYMLSNMMNSVIRADGSPAMATLSMLVGAVLNIVLDPIFIYVAHLGMAGAAWATIIGQIVSFIISVIYFLHTKTFKLQFNSFIMDFRVFFKVIKLGVSTFVTQVSIVIISLVCNIMLVKYGTMSEYGVDIPIAVIGIVMKVFTIVINIVVGIILGAQPILGYNYGAGKYDRVKSILKLVVGFTCLVGIIATLIFELFPQMIINLFGSEDGLYNQFAQMTFRIFLAFVLFTCLIKISSIFFQAVGQPIKSAIVSLTRDIVFFVPLVCILPVFMGIKGVLWAAPIADGFGIIITVVFLVLFFHELQQKQLQSNIATPTIQNSTKGVIITISRQHGSAGKQIGKLVAEQLHIPFYYKETTALVAQESGLSQDYLQQLQENSQSALYDLYLSTTVAQVAIQAQANVLRQIADHGSCVIVGRSADYVLKDYDQLIRIFIYALEEYRIQKIQSMYGDDLDTAKDNMHRSDKSRSNYYHRVTGQEWGNYHNYDLCIDSSMGEEATANIIVNYIKTYQSQQKTQSNNL